MNLVFLSYLSRSGSTFLSGVLDSHPKIWVSTEADFPRSLLGLGKDSSPITNETTLEDYVDLLLDDPKFREWGLAPETLLQRLAPQVSFPCEPSALFSPLMRLSVGHHGHPIAVSVVKCHLPRPSNFRTLLRAFPGSRMIFLVRDPRAVFNSQRSAQRSDMPFKMAHSPTEFARDWARECQVALELSSSDSLLVLRYEKLVEDLDGQMAIVYRWLGLLPATDGYHSPATPYLERIPTAQAHLHPNVSLSPSSNRVLSWQGELSRDSVVAIERIAAGAMESLGYLPIGGEASVSDVFLLSLWRSKSFLIRQGTRGLKALRLIRSGGRMRREILKKHRRW